MSTVFDISRLKRKYWGSDADGLAQEIIALLHTINTEGFGGPLKITTEGTEPAIEIFMPPEFEGTPVQITRGDDQYGIPPFPTEFTPANPPGFDPFEPVGPGNEPFTDPFTGLVPPPVDPDDTEAAAGSPVPDPDESGNTGTVGGEPSFMPVRTLGTIVSGSGTDYVVGVWLQYPGDTLGNATYMEIPAKAPAVDSGEDVPDGTLVDVTMFYKTDGTHGVSAVITVPVWM